MSAKVPTDETEQIGPDISRGFVGRGVENFFQIGWSKDGKFAYKGPPHVGQIRIVGASLDTNFK